MRVFLQDREAEGSLEPTGVVPVISELIGFGFGSSYSLGSKDSVCGTGSHLCRQSKPTYVELIMHSP